MAVYSLGRQSQEIPKEGSGSRGATIESTRKTEKLTRFQLLNSSARQSEYAVASRLTMVRITTPGTSVPGYQLSSYPRLKPTTLRAHPDLCA